MFTGYAINGAGLLIPLMVDTIVTKYPSNQVTNNNNNFIVKVIVFVYIEMRIYFGGFPFVDIKL